MSSIKKIFNEEVNHFQWIDLIIIAIIGLVYGIISFINLGDNYSPNTFYHMEKDDSIVFQFSQDVDIIKMKYFTGVRSSAFRLYTSSDGVEYTYLNTFSSHGVLKWDDIRVATKTKYLKLSAVNEFILGEVGFFDNYQSYIPYSSFNKVLYDEKDMIPKKISSMNSSYFDEIYFARTAYEYVFHMSTYEWTHPPLGKLIQAIPIFITHKITPFLYRLMGNISGILLVLVMYIFGLVLFRNRKYALISSLLISFDTFHFAHTRMGTVDSHLVLFNTLAILFMVLFIKKDKNLYLFLSGLFFGLTVCVKWSGFYGGLALAILYFSYLIYSKKINFSYIIKGFSFFVIVPLILYLSIFYIFSNNLYRTNSLKNIILENKKMYEYHSNLNATHSFSSPFISWPISYKPVWYEYSYYEKTDTASTISGVGNIVIWYAGIIALIYSLIIFIVKKDKTCFFFLVCFLSMWIPYAFIGRIMYLYHYFPVLPILFLAIVYLLRDLEEKYKLKRLIPIYLLCCFMFFLIYYPIVSGIEVSSDFIDKLELFESWNFN